MPKHVHRLSDIDSEARTGTCAVCGQVKLKKCGNGWRCQISYRSNKSYGGPTRIERRIAQLRDELLAAQGGICALCGREANSWCLDHDHDNGMVRDVLCYSCNVGLGQFGDDPDRLMQAVDYLIAWRAKHASSEYPLYRK